jgi:endonuclease/exonuclease/phosphatase family metal-dependent hydrolase
VVKTFFLWLCLSAAVSAETLTVATYNIQNYTVADRMTAEGYRKAYPKPESEKQALRQVIRAMDADILALQEMGPAPYLEELRRDLKSGGLDYPAALLLEGPDADRHVALLAKRPPVAVRRYADVEFAYFGGREKVKRGVLEVTFMTDAGELTFFIVHLKSRLTDREDDPESSLRRAAEAQAVRELILKRFPSPAQARFIVLGDCNDNRGSKPLQALLKRGGLEIASLLPATDSRGEVWTHHYAKEDSYSRVDHLMASSAALPFVVGGAAHIYDGAATGEASDHRPVVATLMMEKPTLDRR